MAKSEQTNKIVLIAARVFFTVLTAAYLCWIFSNSLETGAQSIVSSDKVQQTMQGAADKVFGEGNVTVTRRFVRKGAHFSEFALLGFLSFFTFYLYFLAKKNSCFLCFCAASAIALAGGAADETIQIFIDGRAASVLDAFLDFGGGECGIFVAWSVFAIGFAVIKKSKRKCMNAGMGQNAERSEEE